MSLKMTYAQGNSVFQGDLPWDTRFYFTPGYRKESGRPGQTVIAGNPKAPVSYSYHHEGVGWRHSCPRTIDMSMIQSLSRYAIHICRAPSMEAICTICNVFGMTRLWSESNPQPPALQTDALTTRPRRRYEMNEKRRNPKPLDFTPAVMQPLNYNMIH